ncbi:hypothetical protein QBC38DRAFT_449855 [Podospora fimiseda]|uniref:Heterokaryon incompatibility domain-containing protein n=1 Tax=Podospora fimiseda TaxID=252190 RepID=A0AAN6YLD4_9PEZI|nr:hypothetical protein QBC38DRAFT_449855 [Podospora fimiseda]
MHEIYRHASYLVVWLGKEDRYVEKAISALSKLSTNMDNFMKSRIVSWDSEETSQVEYLSSGVPWICQDEWDGLAALFLRQWFRRIWIVQEIVLSGGVFMYCGERPIEWTQVKQTAEAFVLETVRVPRLGRYSEYYDAFTQRYRPAKNYGYPEIHSIRFLKENFALMKLYTQQNRHEKYMEISTYFSSYNLMIRLSGFCATNPRDLCYALLPLRTVSYHKSTLVPNYTSLVEQVYMDFTKEMMATEEKPLQVLSLGLARFD